MRMLIVSLCIIISSIVSTASYAQKGKEKMQTGKDSLNQPRLPAAVQATVEKEFPGFVIKATRKFESGIPYYEVEIENGKESYSLQISQEGKMLKKTAIKAEAKEPEKEY